MKAMILAAGSGTRLRPLTLKIPKVLLPVRGVPLLEYQLAWLKSHGISQVAINLYHLGEKIKALLDDGSHYGFEIFYSSEPKLLGTAGGVKRMEYFFNNTFIVAYGDVFTDFNLSDMVNLHHQKKAIATIAVSQVSNPREAGMVEIDKDGKITNFVEKPHRDIPLGNLGNGGVYVLDKEIFSHIPADSYSDFACDVFPRLIKLNLPVYGHTLKPEDYLIDIGTTEKYQKANADIKPRKAGYGKPSCIS